MLTIIIAIAIVFVFVLIIAWLTDSPFIRTIATGICFVVVLIGCTIGYRAHKWFQRVEANSRN